MNWKEQTTYNKHLNINRIVVLQPLRRANLLKTFFNKYRKTYLSAVRIKKYSRALSALSNILYRHDICIAYLKLKQLLESQQEQEHTKLINRVFLAWHRFVADKKQLKAFMAEKSDSDISVGLSVSKASVKDHILSIISPKYDYTFKPRHIDLHKSFEEDSMLDYQSNTKTMNNFYKYQ